MTVAGEEENSGLRVGPYVPDSAVEPTDGSAENAVTQLVPVVRAEPTMVDAPPGRAVAQTPAPPLETLPEPEPFVGAEVVAEPDGEIVEPEPADLPETPAEDIAEPAPPPTTELVRPGPFMLEADSWDTPPDTDSKNEAYQGRRRAEAPAARLWIAITVVLVGLGVAVAVPLALMRSSGGDGVAAPSTPARAGVLAVTDSTASSSPTPSSGPTVTVRSPSPSPAKTKAAPPPPPRRTASPTTSPPPPPFEPVTHEAEAADANPDGITGSAWVWGYPGASGGSIVRNIGNWGSEPGVLRISEVMVPSTGTYVITIHYVHPDGEGNRSALVSVSGIAPTNVSFTPGESAAVCCFTKALTVALTAGPHTITITNATSRAPSIDRIVLSRP